MKVVPPGAFRLRKRQAAEFTTAGFTLLHGLAPLLRTGWARHAVRDAATRATPAFVRLHLRDNGCGVPAETPIAPLRDLAECTGGATPTRIPGLHMHSEGVRRMIDSEGGVLGRVASQLLGLQAVSLYSSAYYRKDGTWSRAATPWHQDLAEVPLDTNAMVTFWCPLQAVGNGDSPLVFAAHSHTDVAARHWYRPSYEESVQSRFLLGAEHRYHLSSFHRVAAGDCTAHHGWTLHAARGGHGRRVAREALALVFVDADARRLPAEDLRRYRPVPGGTASLVHRDWYDGGCTSRKQCMTKLDVWPHTWSSPVAAAPTPVAGEPPQEQAQFDAFGGASVIGVARSGEPWRRVPLSQQIRFAVEGHTVVPGLVPHFRNGWTRNAVRLAGRRAAPQYFHKALHDMGCPDLEADCTRLSTIDDCVAVLRTCKQRTQRSLPYFQFLHLHKISPDIATVAQSRRLGYAAATLLGVRSVRLYQTGLFIKRADWFPNATGWHQDLNMVPLDTSSYITFWCPLQRLTHNDTVLMFASRSHRDVALKHWFTTGYGRNQTDRMVVMMQDRYHLEKYDDLRPGDCTAHHGWTYHAAKQADERTRAREAVTFSFVDSNALRLPDSVARRYRGVPAVRFRSSVRPLARRRCPCSGSPGDF